MSDTTEHQTPQQLRIKYRYERILGEGSNGKTYLATDLSTGKQVAIKALKLVQSENFKSFELFKREAETLSSIQVPGVPQFYQSILSEKLGEECYIVQEYIDAPSIQNYLNEGRIFSETETLTIMQKVAAILHILHSQYSPPVIHRDIKPSNLLCRLPETSDKEKWDSLKLYLIDFGAVANAHSNSDKSTIAGTIGYMAPEQNFGESLPQTDLYALGATALHMLTGVPPYEMDFDTYSIKYIEALNQYAPNTSEGMRELLGRLLNYSIDKRPATAAELTHMIANVREGRSVDEVAAQLTEQGMRAAIQKLWKEAYQTNSQFPLAVFLRNMWLHLKTAYREHMIDNLPPAKYLAMLKQPDKYADNLRATWGTATNFSSAEFTPGKISSLIEFTFDIDGITWSGISTLPVLFASKDTMAANRLNEARKLAPLPIKTALEIMHYAHKFATESAITLPVPCIVLYHPEDPSCNWLCCLDLCDLELTVTDDIDPDAEAFITSVSWDSRTTLDPNTTFQYH